jgi:hypothetical protein
MILTSNFLAPFVPAASAAAQQGSPAPLFSSFEQTIHRCESGPSDLSDCDARPSYRTGIQGSCQTSTANARVTFILPLFAPASASASIPAPPFHLLCALILPTHHSFYPSPCPAIHPLFISHPIRYPSLRQESLRWGSTALTYSTRFNSLSEMCVYESAYESES